MMLGVNTKDDASFFASNRVLVLVVLVPLLAERLRVLLVANVVLGLSGRLFSVPQFAGQTARDSF
jgi:hypothetical protein